MCSEGYGKGTTRASAGDSLPMPASPETFTKGYIDRFARKFARSFSECASARYPQELTDRARASLLAGEAYRPDGGSVSDRSPIGQGRAALFTRARPAWERLEAETKKGATRAPLSVGTPEGAADTEAAKPKAASTSL